MGKRDRSRQPARREPYKNPRRRLLVVTEGKITEPQYISSLANWARNPLVEVVTHGPAGVPGTLVRTAKKLSEEASQQAKTQGDDNLRFDEVWCVFDVDDHPNWRNAKQMGLDNGFSLAISNPSIELWLLLHFREQPGMRHRDKIRSLLREHDSDYEKHVKFERYQDYVQIACERAAKLDAIAFETENVDGNPTTGFYRLVGAIRSSD